MEMNEAAIIYKEWHAYSYNNINVYKDNVVRITLRESESAYYNLSI